MTTTPLPRWTLERSIDLVRYVPAVEADRAIADLEAENKRLREALQAVVSFWDRLNFDGSPINELHTAARAALESKP